MISLSLRDASIITNAVRATKLDRAQRERLLQGASEAARQVGLYSIDQTHEVDSETKATADEFQRAFGVLA